MFISCGLNKLPKKRNSAMECEILASLSNQGLICEVITTAYVGQRMDLQISYHAVTSV